MSATFFLRTFCYYSIFQVLQVFLKFSFELNVFITLRVLDLLTFTNQ